MSGPGSFAMLLAMRRVECLLLTAPTPLRKSPGDWQGLQFNFMGSYILGLHFLALASHTPPALVHAAFVFAVPTSAAKAGAVKANASPKATIIESSFDIGTLLLVTEPHTLLWRSRVTGSYE